jgi:molybdopterin converting factor small subunit
MKVKLIIYSKLKEYVEGYNNSDGIVKEVTSPKSIRQFLAETINHEQAMDAISMVIVNDKVIPFKQLDRKLKDKDIIKVYPPMGGG